ncbi:nuclear transport factor 2 family protein [Bradyrhizobium sp.]|jgi:hypothetical protein|uniref:nuclear transport factor 2 family protein n=1 Tax=Bradyrhizobium sp. TaxID=376 RepID=UPI0025B99748|nr:nuclear transport factor 2 family protein [Bradyrhizobium sp.]
MRRLGLALKRGEIDMTNSVNSAIDAMPRQPERYRRYLSIAAALCLVIMTVASGGRASAAASEAEARSLFTKFVAAQNAHNIDDVKAMLWNSPSMLWFSRGVETRGREAVADRFREYYEGTWHLEPDMSQFRVAAISNDVMQILVPIVFTRGLPGKPPQDNTFLISQTLVRDGNGWYIASILPIANTQLK